MCVMNFDNVDSNLNNTFCSCDEAVDNKLDVLVGHLLCCGVVGKEWNCGGTENVVRPSAVFFIGRGTGESRGASVLALRPA